MRYSQLFTRTSRQVSRDVKAASHSLLLRAGFVRQLGPGLYAYLPLGQRVLKNIRRIIDDEMQQLGGCEVLIPLVNPVEIWRSSGRDESAGNALLHFSDSSGRELVLAPTHEEAVVELVRASINSYRDLPLFVYQFQGKFRDEKRPRHGLLRLREFMMKDGYSFHRSFSDLNTFFPKVFSSYERIFRRCGIDAIAAEAGVGIMGGERAYEFHTFSEAGDDVIVRCKTCGYTANREIAVGQKATCGGSPKELQIIATPDCNTMAKLARFLDLPRQRLAKTMIFRTNNHLIMAVVRADSQVSLEKLTQVCGETITGLASPADLRQAGMSPGYVSVIGFSVSDQLDIIVDDAVANTPNLVMGANREGYHCINANFGRDFESGKVADIARIGAHNPCLHCGGDLQERTSIELGNIFRLGTFYTKRMGLEVQEDNGGRVYPCMGAYGIGMDRLMAAVVERHHDERGIIWPFDLAPFRGYLLSIGKSLRLNELTESLYRELKQYVLFDDRPESISSKMKEAHLLGIPYLLIVSPDTIASGMVEVVERRSLVSKHVPTAMVINILEDRHEFSRMEDHSNRN
ncbi:MAG: proline--tRNA ligase [Spirochaetaceae bacterium]|nr:MAG: proline--tRNA ligase [Spirochaetaceae bacterium]